MLSLIDERGINTSSIPTGFRTIIICFVVIEYTKILRFRFNPCTGAPGLVVTSVGWVGIDHHALRGINTGGIPTCLWTITICFVAIDFTVRCG